MADEQPPLEPDDFPVEARKSKILKQGGEPIADVCNQKTAEEIAERLNEDEERREEDRWSA
jgi:hypothetical protein